MTMSPSLASLAPALSAAQGELTDANKSSKNPHFNSKYADLAEILQTARPVLSKHGLALVQTVGYFNKAEGTIQVTTTLLHKSGEYISDALTMPVGKVDAQGVVAAVTYARRTSSAAIIGISQDDDDGETAVGRGASDAPSPKAKGGKRAKPEVDPPAEPMTADQLVKAFEAATKENISELGPHFALLKPDEQTKVLPAVKAARARLGV